MKFTLSAPALAGKTDKEKLDIIGNKLCELIDTLAVTLSKLDEKNFRDFNAAVEGTAIIAEIESRLDGLEP